MSGSSEGRASVPVRVVQEGHKLSVTWAEWGRGAATASTWRCPSCTT